MSKCYLCDEDALAIQDNLDEAIELLERALKADGPKSIETAHEVRIAINKFIAQRTSEPK